MKPTTTGSYSFHDDRENLGIEAVYGKHVIHDFSRHTHRTLCIGIIEDGMRTLLCRGKEYKIIPGQIFVIPPNESHSCGTVAEPHSYRLLLVSSAVLRMILPNFDEDRNIFNNLVFENQNLFAQLLHLHRILEGSETNFVKQSTVVAVIGDVVEKCVDAQHNFKLRAKQHESVKRAQVFIEENYGENFSLADIANHVYLSPYYLIRVFTRVIGLPPHIYQQQVRIRHAKEMLTQGFALAEVASQTGFTDQSHFSHVFKKMVGVTPGEYKTS